MEKPLTLSFFIGGRVPVTTGSAIARLDNRCLRSGTAVPCQSIPSWSHQS
jgi:hypothetical protein